MTIGEKIHDLRVRNGMTMEDLAREINLMGMEITPLIISRIEKGQRHVCDGELLMISRALHVTMEWLCGMDE